MQISKETLQKLLFTHKIPSVVLDAVFSFGAKVTGEDDPYSNICYRKLFPNPAHDPDNDQYYGEDYLTLQYLKS